MKAWIYEPVITDHEILLFYNALRRHQDNYHYHPIALAKREETGIKYRFFCIAAFQAAPDLPTQFADVEVYKPSNGAPYISGIYYLDYKQMFAQRYPNP